MVEEIETLVQHSIQTMCVVRSFAPVTARPSQRFVRSSSYPWCSHRLAAALNGITIMPIGINITWILFEGSSSLSVGSSDR